MTRTEHPRAEAAAARAPGRVNLIGEHTDYNGGRVLPAAIELGTRVAVRLRADDRVVGRSRERGEASAELREPARGDWLDYPRGVARELERIGAFPPRGFELEVESDLPEGAGLSSSAALEAASALALLAAAGAAAGQRISRAELAQLCQRAEAGFVGVPCGIMDQFTVLCSQPGRALWLDCATLATRAVALPADWAILVFDSGVERSLRAGAYAERRRECERALAAARRALARAPGSLSEIAEEELPALAQELDPVALRRTRHVVSENRRVEALAQALSRADAGAAGRAMFASHDSLRDDFEVSCAQCDWLVADARELGCVGARMTGAGFGGCVVALCEETRAAAFAAALAERFRERFGRMPRHFRTRAAGPAALVG
ncbi:MAG TPA: galactokinase [Myxococcota bacterium]|nr:galactokinase [Myxococcota bacterium]